MKKIYFIYFLLLFIIITGCTKDFVSDNTDTKHPAAVTGESVFTNAEKSLVDQISSTDENWNIFKLWAQYWTETTYTTEADYNVVSRSIPDNTFQVYYQNILENFKDASTTIAAKATNNQTAVDNKNNELAIIDLLCVYAYQNLVDIFGNVPYSQALNINSTITPAYDDAFTIYKDLITRATKDVNSLNDTVAGSFGSADLIYNGNILEWIKFGNSLLVKLGITISDYSPALAQSTIQSAYAGAFTSNADDALLPYIFSSQDWNPLYNFLVVSGRNDFVPANTLVNVMDSLNDTRIGYYMTTVDTSTTNTPSYAYVGGPYGAPSPFPQYSHIANRIELPTFQGILLTYNELLFYLAEAAQRGFNVGNTAANYYANAITQSFIFCKASPSQASTYLANPAVAYTGGPNWKQQIGTQAWIALYTRGLGRLHRMEAFRLPNI